MNPRIYNSRDLRYKTPFGAVPRGSTVTFHLAVPRAMHCKTPYLCLRAAGQQKAVLTQLAPAGSRGEDDLFELAYTPAEVGTCFYWFDLYINYNKVYRGDFGEGYLSQNASGPLYQLTVYDETFTTPQTAHGAVMYQIFPDRFYEGVPKTAMSGGSMFMTNTMTASSARNTSPCAMPRRTGRDIGNTKATPKSAPVALPDSCARTPRIVSRRCSGTFGRITRSWRTMPVTHRNTGSCMRVAKKP